MMKKKAADLRTLDASWDTHTTCMVNSSKGLVAGVLLRINYSVHKTALALGVIQVLDGRNFQSC